MLLSYMPSNLWASSIAFIATIVLARPLLGAHYAILGALYNFYLWYPLGFGNSRSLARMEFERRL
jgi:hypothetical protein